MKISQMNVEISSPIIGLERILDIYGITNIDAVRRCRTFGIVTTVGPTIYKHDNGSNILNLNYKIIKINDFNEKMHPSALSDADILVLHEDTTKIGMVEVKGIIEKYHNSYSFNCTFNNMELACTIYMKDVLKVVFYYEKTNELIVEYNFNYGMKEPVPRNWAFVKSLLLLNGIFLIDDMYRYIKISFVDNIEVKYGEYENLNRYGFNSKDKYDLISNIAVYDDGIYKIYKKRYKIDLYDIEFLVVDPLYITTSSSDQLRDKSVIIMR